MNDIVKAGAAESSSVWTLIKPKERINDKPYDF